MIEPRQTQDDLEKSQSSTKLSCETCGLKFQKPSKLQRHIDSVHKSIKPFVCKVDGCDFSCKRKDGLQRHMSSKHATKRDAFPCPYTKSDNPEDVCLSTFPNKDQLRKHIARAHTYRYQCHICVNQDQLKLSDQDDLEKQPMDSMSIGSFQVS